MWSRIRVKKINIYSTWRIHQDANQHKSSHYLTLLPCTISRKVQIRLVFYPSLPLCVAPTPTPNFFRKGKLIGENTLFLIFWLCWNEKNYCIRRFVDKNWRLKVSKFSATITWICLPYCSVHHLSFFIYFLSEQNRCELLLFIGPQ